MYCKPLQSITSRSLYHPPKHSMSGAYSPTLFPLVPIFLTYHFWLHPIILPLFLAKSQFFHNTINLFRSSDVSPMQVRCKSHLSPIFLQAKYRRYLQDVYDLQTNRRAPLARCPPYILYNVSLNLPHQFNFLTAVFPAKAGE